MSDTETALEKALEALEQANKTAEIAVEAINTVADALQDLVEVLLAEEEGSDADEQPVFLAEPVNKKMPPISGEDYPEYAAQVREANEAGEPDPLIPVMHVAPINDTYPHELTFKVCWCNPEVQAEGGGYIIVHKAADGRDGPPVDKPTKH